MLTDLAEDIKTPQLLIGQLEALNLTGAAKEQSVALEAGYAIYFDDISTFMKAAVADPKAMLPRVGEIEQANARTDQSLRGADDVFTRLAAAELADAQVTMSQTRILTITTCLVGLLALTVCAFLIARSITQPRAGRCRDYRRRGGVAQRADRRCWRRGDKRVDP